MIHHFGQLNLPPLLTNQYWRLHFMAKKSLSLTWLSHGFKERPAYFIQLANMQIILYERNMKPFINLRCVWVSNCACFKELSGWKGTKTTYFSFVDKSKCCKYLIIFVLGQKRNKTNGCKKIKSNIHKKIMAWLIANCLETSRL